MISRTTSCLQSDSSLMLRMTDSASQMDITRRDTDNSMAHIFDKKDISFRTVLEESKLKDNYFTIAEDVDGETRQSALLASGTNDQDNYNGIIAKDAQSASQYKH